MWVGGQQGAGEMLGRLLGVVLGAERAGAERERRAAGKYSAGGVQRVRVSQPGERSVDGTGV